MRTVATADDGSSKDDPGEGRHGARHSLRWPRKTLAAIVALGAIAAVVLAADHEDVAARAHRTSQSRRAVAAVSSHAPRSGCAAGPHGIPSGDIAYCAIGALLAAPPRHYSPPVPAARVIAAYAQNDDLLQKSVLEHSRPIAALHLVTVRSCCSGVRRGTSFPGWVVQAEVPFDKSFGYNGPRPIDVKRMIPHPSWVVCDAALFDLANQRWLEAWEGPCQGCGSPGAG